MTYAVTTLRMADHRKSLIRLWENFDNPRIADLAAERLSWFYDQNPLGPAKTWLVSGDDDRIIGCGSAFPWNKHVNGRTVMAGVSSDFAVDPKGRTAGPALALQRSVLAGSAPAGFEFLVGAANHKSRAVCLRAGYQAIGAVYRWVKPLQAEYWLSRHVKSPFLTKAAASLVAWALALLDRWRRMGLPSAGSCEDLEKADARFDELWNRTKDRYRIAGERSARYLNWRYTACPEIKYRFYALFGRDDQRLSAYLIYSIEEQKVMAVDLFAETPQSTAIDSLLLEFADRMRALGRHSVELAYFGNVTFEKHLRRLGFFRREERQTIVLYAGTTGPDDLRTTLSGKDNWFLLGGEMDV
jgi:hypothetical protein